MSREQLSTGALLTKLGNRVGQPVRPVAQSRRRPLLPVQAASPVPTAGASDQDARVSAVVTLLKQIAAWDADAVERARAVARYAVAIAGALAPPAEVPRIRNAALLCNIGLTAVPRELLAKVDALTPAEQQLIRRHAIHGAEILQEVVALRDEVVLVLHHHEDYDGGGYPYGVSGDWIPLGARIIRVAETYDALLQTRPFRPALTPGEALAELHAGSGRTFDPRCVAALATYLSHERPR
ncbi:MAG TPA: HD domain-containing phosphohydrolase [Thermomicrobiales bacterium]